MGLQTATLTRIGPLTVHTTFVTGMLNKLAQLTSHVVFHSLEAQRSTGRNREAHRHARREKGQSALFLLAIWICYLGGALAGTALDRRYGPVALLLPCLLLLSAVAVDQLDPLAVEEEADESER
jgi:uncharacterized membrane protein YoaK (UPF0700 family)